MTIDEFWGVVGSLEGEAPVEVELADRLKKLSPSEVVECQAHFDKLFWDAYRWDLWGAAYTIGGGCSDDGFIDFRYGLISKGKEIYEKAIEHPDSLADLGGEADLENEGFGYVFQEVYEEMTGQEMPRKPVSSPREPVGEEWDFDDDKEVAERLPRLSVVAKRIMEDNLRLAREVLAQAKARSTGDE